METVIEARSLVKRYDRNNVVDGVDFSVRRGECFGILGPNGAGKTSTLRMMYTVSPMTSGELFILGFNARTNPNQIKSKIGVLPQDNGLDPDFSVLDNLLVYARYHGIPAKKAKTRARELLRFMHLDEFNQRRVPQLSGGMQRRLAFARALINEPDLLFLDEPTTGLDPQARYWIWEALEEKKNQGKSLVLTTHYMEEAERLCDRIIIMDKGKILTEGSPSDLILEHVGSEVIEVRFPVEELDYISGRVNGKFEYQVINNKIHLFIKENQDPKEAIKYISSDNLVVRKASLNDVFLKLAGYELRQ